jgi:hypothetical protein
MIRQLRLTAAIVLLSIAAACASTPLLDSETVAMRSVTAARQVATAALRAGKISVADDQKAQANLTLIATGIKAAVAAQDAAAVAANQKAADDIKTELEKK